MSGRPDPLPGEIAIVGMACRFPGAPSIEKFWEILRDGVETLSVFDDESLLAAGVPRERLTDPAFVPAGGRVGDIDRFDPAFFGFSPAEAGLVDPQSRLLLECAWEALENGGHASSGPERSSPIGVFAGTGVNTYFLNVLTRTPGALDDFGVFETMIANDKDYLATLISYRLNLTGPSITIQTACSTSLVAVHMACQSLLAGECDLALAGGVSLSVPEGQGYVYQEGMIHSPDGHCRPFSDDSAGTVDSGGAGMVLLQPLAEALASGATIYGIIRGSAINNDGARKVGYTAPGLEGQARAIAEAQRVAGIRPDDVGLIEAHGTATPLGDPIEVAALTRAWRAESRAVGTCALGSAKSNMGHTGAAAGVAGLIKATLALHHRTIPPSLHFRAPNPNLALASSPFFVPTRALPWPGAEGSRIAGVSSFGIGGTNAHVVVAENRFPPPPAATAPRPWHVLPLSAHQPEALAGLASALAQRLAAASDLELGAVAHTLQAGRRAFPFRRVVCGPDRESIVAALERIAVPAQPAPERRGIAFMMTGHGSQAAGMTRRLFEQEPVFREELQRLAAHLRQLTGIDAQAVLYPPAGGEEAATAELGRMAVSQPVMFIVQMALVALWRSWGVVPEAVAGHSSGEYAAACVAGVMSPEDALMLVAERGRLMDRTEPGGMIALDYTERELARAIGSGLSVAVVNAPELCVVSGAEGPLAEFAALLDGRGVEYRRLHVSRAAHSPTMEAIVGALGTAAQRVRFHAPRLPYASAVTGAWADGAEIATAEYWARHLRAQVRFGDAVTRLLERADVALVEIGPGNALSTFARMSPAATPGLVAVPSLPRPWENKEGEDQTIASSLGRLWECGATIDWEAYRDGQARRLVSLPNTPFVRRRCWIDAPRSEASAAVQHRPATRRPDPADWFHLPGWKRSAPLSPSGAAGAGRPLALLTPPRETRFVTALAGALSEAGWQVQTIPPDAGETMAARFVAAQEQSAAPAVIVHARTLEAEDSEAEALGHASLCQLGAILGAMPDRPVDIVVLGNALHAVTGMEALAPERTLLVGPAKVIPQEFAHLRTHVIDLEWPVEGRASGEAADERLRCGVRLESVPAGFAIGQIVAAVGAAERPALQAFRGVQRWLPEIVPLRIESSGPALRPLRHGGVYLLTGGLGSLGLTIAAHLARACQARLALVGRHVPLRAEGEALATDPRWADTTRRLREMEAAGGELRLFAADCADADRMAAVVGAIESEWGRIDGVIHAAGEIGAAIHQPLDSHTASHAAAQLRAKLAGTRVLEQLFSSRKPDFVVLMSSMAAVLGGLGFADYAAANAALDTFAWRAARRAPGRWLSLNWDSWRVTADDRRAVSAFDGLEMSAGEGLGAFLCALEHGHGPQIMVSPGDLAPRLAAWIDERARRDASTGLQDAEHLGAEPPATPEDGVQGGLIAIWRRLLGQESIGPDSHFFELGGHSLLATRVLAQVRQRFGVSLSLRTLFAAPILREMAAAIAEAGGTAARTTLAPVADAPASVTSSAGITGPAPLSWPQRQVWLVHQLEPEAPLYAVPLAMRLRGRLNATALHRALTEVVARHEALRTTFPVRDGQPVQAVRPAAEVTLPVCAAGDESTLAQLVAEEVTGRFDLEAGPLLRARLIARSADDHTLVLVPHHLVIDGWSLALVVRELFTLYDAFAAGRPSPLPPCGQYGEFARWQQATLIEDVLERQRAYWREQLAGLPAVHGLIPDHPPSGCPSFASDTVSLILGPAVAARVRALAAAEGASTFMVLLAAFAALLYRLTGRDDQAVITSSANRTESWQESIVGLFVAMLVLRIRPDGSQGLRALTRAVRKTSLDAFANAEVPLASLVADLRPPRQRGRHPLAQIGFVVQNMPREGRGPDGLDVSWVPTSGSASQYDLLCSISEEDARLAVSLEYRTDLFERATIRRLADGFATLLASALDDPERPIDALDVVPVQDVRALAGAWSSEPVATPPELTAVPALPHAASLVELVRAAAVANPRVEAIRHHGGRSIDYGTLWTEVETLAARLTECGVKRGDRVTVELPRGPERVMAFLGVLAAGAVYVPLDPAQPEARRHAMANEVAPAARIAADGLTRLAGSSQEVADAREHLAYILHTSGSTGRPKGVMVGHAGLASLAREQHRLFAAGPGDRVLQLAACGFDAWIWEVAMALCGGATLVTADAASLLPGADLLRVLEDCEITHLTITPPALEALPKAPLPALRVLISAGAALPADLARRWADRAYLFNAYGPTETTVCATVGRCDPARGRIGIGRPLTGRLVHILDHAGRPVPPGIAGELHVGGEGLAAGYLEQPELTRRAFGCRHLPGLEHPRRLYATGDLVRFRHGGDAGAPELEFLGRIDGQLKIRGFRIEPEEVSACLRSHPAVREAAVVGHPRNQPEALAAYVVLADPTADPADIRRHVAKRLPDFMVPSWLVPVASLPLTSNGKLDPDRLPDPAHLGKDDNVQPPCDEMERRLATLWSEALGTRSLGVRTNFFETGGTSLLAVRLATAIGTALGRPLPAAALFEHPTIEALAARLREEGAAPAPRSVLHTLAGAGRTGTPSFWCPGLGARTADFGPLARHLGQDRPVYGLARRGADGSAPPDKSVAAMVARQVEAILRLSPEGPVLLGGHSLGGQIAWRIAASLREAGVEVALLCILDGLAPGVGAAAVPDNPSPEDLLGWLVADLAAAAGAPLAPGPIGSLAEAVGRLRCGCGLDLSQAELAARATMMRADLELARLPVPPPPVPLDVPCLLITAGRGENDGGPATTHFGPDLGWSAFVARPWIDTLDTASHASLLAQPHVAALAERLRHAFGT